MRLSGIGKHYNFKNNINTSLNLERDLYFELLIRYVSLFLNDHIGKQIT